MGDKTRGLGLLDKRRKGKTMEPTNGDDDHGSRPSEEEEASPACEPLLSYLAQYELLLESTADVLKDEIRIIRERKIDKNKATLEKETTPEVVRMSKSIVIGFQDSIAKAVKDLQLLGSTMAEELQKRFNLPLDWHLSGSVFGSVTGSDIMGPTFRSREMHNRISTFINDSEAANEEAMRAEATSNETRQDPDDSFMDFLAPPSPSRSSPVDTGFDDDDDSRTVLMGPSFPKLKRPKVERVEQRSEGRTEIKVTGSDIKGSTFRSKEMHNRISPCINGSAKANEESTRADATSDETKQDPNESAAANEESLRAEATSNETNQDPNESAAANEKSIKSMRTETTSNESSQDPNDSFMDFLAPPSPTSPVDTGFDDDDDTRTVLMGSSFPKLKPPKVERVEQRSEDSSKIKVTETPRTSSLPAPAVPSTSTSATKEKDVDKSKDAEKPVEKDDKETKGKAAQRRKDDDDIDDRAIMRELLTSSSDSDSPGQTPSLSRKPKKASIEKKQDCEHGKEESSRSAKDDPKLKAKVEINITRIDPAIEKCLAENTFVHLKDFDVFKRKSCADLENQSDSLDSDSSGADSSNEALKKLVKDLTKKSVLRTKKYNKKRGKDENLPGRSKNTKMKSTRDSFKSGGLDSDTDSDDDGDNSKRTRKTDPLRLSDDAIISDSGSEDLSCASDGTVKEKSKSNTTKQSKDSKGRKYYKPVSISSDESGNDAMREVLGSDSDSDAKGKRSFSQNIKKEKGSDSATDSDFASPRKTRKRTLEKKKRKRGSSDSDISLITVDSDDSDDSDFKSPKKSSKRRGDRDSSPEQSKKNKKKRRRIIVKDSSSNSDSDEIQEIPQDPEDPKEAASRKNIRKIMKSKHLAKTTKEAERDEEERRKRLLERQKTFNGVHKAPESDKTERLVLDADPETNEPVVEVDKTIVAHLKPHQVEGIKFMYNACFESVQMIKEDKVPGGCILAHCMGLGKTLQSVAFMHTMLTNKLCDTKTVLVICPLSTVTNWYNETRSWTEEAMETLKIHKLYEMKNKIASRLDHLNVWKRRGGVGILHYDMFRRLADPKGKTKMKESLRTAIKEALLDPGPDMVICDEGHLLKNCKSILSLAVNNIRTHRRIVLTGTPLQNNLVEYHTMMSFVKPNLLGSLPEFTNRFVNPIKNGQHADSTDYDVKTMKRRSHVLHRKLEGCVQRCDYLILAPYLPPKYEYIINIKLSEKQEQLYKHYLGSVVNPDPDARRKCLLKYYAELVKVWSHPIALTMRKITNEEEEEATDNSLDDFIVDGTTEDESEGSNGAPKKSKRKTRAQAGNDPEPDNIGNGLDDVMFGGKWWNAVFKSKSEMADVDLSGKLVILQEILKTSEAIGDKVLVFSQFLTSLDIIEEFLQDWDNEEVQRQKDNKDIITFPLTETRREGRWRRNIEYYRIDGNTKVSDRHRDCEKFNKKSTLSRAKLFLISTRAGGLGINLFGANRVVIFDASWNPSQDMQSIFRVYRFGQDKPCYIYRLIARGTMEEKILRRQITKLSLSSRVVDEHQIQRHFKFDDVNEMYKYDEEDPSTQDAVLAVPKDRLLADLLMSHRSWIRSYEEFDSLLENKPDEGLSNEEKEVAWEEYRIESTKAKSNLSHTNSTMQAETYVKVKPRLAEKYPDATEEQLEQATDMSLQVINKIREGMLMLNQPGMYDGHPVKTAIDRHIDPLKVWLAQSIQPTGEHGTILEDLIFKPLPSQFYQQLPGSYQQRAMPQPFNNPYTQQNIRPPIIRRPTRMPQSQMPVQNIHNNFQTIASNAVPSVRQQLLLQRLNADNAMNGQQ